jgi:hypothetical protein
MTTPFDRPFSETTDDDRLMTEADREALEREADNYVRDRTSDPRDGDRTTDVREADRTTDRRDGEADLAGSEASAGLTTGTASSSQDYDALVAQDVAVDFRTRWQVVQEGFVDDPRNAVSEADRLVDELLKRLSETFDQQHHGLEEQWSDGEPSTEDLRRALQRYRAFFQRLLAI